MMKLSLYFLIFCGMNLITRTAFAGPDLGAKLAQFQEKFESLKDPEDKIKKLSELDRDIEKNSDSNDKYLLKVMKGMLAAKVDAALAETIFKELISENKNLTEYIYYYYGQLLVSTQRWAEARSQYEKILSLSPNAKLQMESQFELAKISLEQKKYREAKHLLSKLERRQRREESYPETIYQLAKAERGLHNHPAFCRWAKKLYTSFPQFSRIESWGSQLPKDEFDGQATGCPVRNEDRKARIKNMQWAGLGSKALEEIQSLRNPLDKGGQYDLDRLEVSYWAHEGEMDKALQILTPYYEAKKSDISFLSQFAVIAARAGEYQAAVGSYYRIYQLAPRGRGGKQALYQAAFMSYQFQDYDGASRKFQEFMKVYSRSGLIRDARWHLAWIRYLRGDYKGSFKSLSALLNEQKKRRRSWKSFPKDRVTYWMAMSLYRQNEYGQAKQLFESLAKDPMVGYYSIAAQLRLKKLEPLLSKSKENKVEEKVALFEGLPRYSRFPASEAMIPADDYAAINEENETEDTMLTESEVESSDDVADGEDDQSVDVQQALVVENDDNVLEKPAFADPNMVKRFERVQNLMVLGLSDWARWDLFDIEKRTRNREYLKNLMQQYQALGNYHRSAYIAQVSFGSQRAASGIEGARLFWEYAYPQAYSKYVLDVSHDFDIPPELEWGIMRAESAYKKDVISPVGALGLMQVMPSTGGKVAEMLKDKDFEPRKLLQPEVAVRIGGKYLQRLSRKFEGNVPLIAAAYNAGPHRVKTWLSSFGGLDVDEFVEHIPFLETRNYVKKVVSNYQVYTLLYSKGKNGLTYLADALNVRIPVSVVTKETWEDI